MFAVSVYEANVRTWLLLGVMPRAMWRPLEVISRIWVQPDELSQKISFKTKQLQSSSQTWSVVSMAIWAKGITPDSNVKLYGGLYLWDIEKGTTFQTKFTAVILDGLQELIKDNKNSFWPKISIHIPLTFCTEMCKQWFEASGYVLMQNIIATLILVLIK